MIRTLALPALFLLMAACSAPKTVTEHLMLSFDASTMDVSRPLSGGLFPFRIQVKELDLGRLYDNANVVIRLSDYTVQFSKRGLWAVRPNLMATDLLLLSLEKGLPCKAVMDGVGGKNPDYVAGGSLRVIEEDARVSPHAARLEVALRLMRYEDESLILNKTYRAAIPVVDTTYAAFARAVSEGFRESCASFIQDAAKALQREQERDHATDSGKGL